MASVTTQEGWFTLPDKHKLYTKTWSPPPAAVKAHLIIVHGFSDHCNTYTTYLTALAARGIHVHAFDQRGWGRSVHSPAQKGLSGPTSLVLADITAFSKSILSETAASGLPVFMTGHSMGGAEVLTYLAQGPSDVVGKLRGVLAEAPFCALHPHTRPWKATVLMGRVAGRVLPKFHMVNKLDSSKLTRDAEFNAQLQRDELCHDTGTLEGLAGMLDRAGALEEGKVVVGEGRCEGGETRVWVGHGTGDMICDFEVTRKVFERARAEDKTLRVYEGWYHVLHAEVGEDKVRFVEDVVQWMMERSGPLGAGGGDEARPRL